MIEKTLEHLAHDLRQRRRVGDRAVVLLLGAGASADAGIGAMSDLMEFLGCANFDAFQEYVLPLTKAERYRYLSDFLQTHDPTEVSEGYQALAQLCANAYFDLILTTNLDPLLDDALASARLRRRDYFLLVNGVTRPDLLDSLLQAGSPRVKVLKLHGDLFMRKMAWTLAEMDSYLADVAGAVRGAIRGRDVLIVGHSLRDQSIRDLVLGAGGTIWYTHPDKVPQDLIENQSVRSVLGDDAVFETLFVQLAQALEVSDEMVPVASDVLKSSRQGVLTQAETMDDLLASVVGVVADNRPPRGTGFVLAEPRVIVTDPFAAPEASEEIAIVTSDGRQFPAPVRGRNRSHPLGPVFLEVPADLSALGLGLSLGQLRPGAPVHAAVATGTLTGISTGTLTTATEASKQIAPIGMVANVVELAFRTTPGASGAPVVTEDFKVVGYVVAGRTDGQPPSYMYPTRHWKQSLG